MAAAALTCSGCGDPFRVIASQTGKKVRCPHCGAVNMVPSSAFDAPPDIHLPDETPTSLQQQDPPQPTSPPNEGVDFNQMAALAQAVQNTNKLGSDDAYRSRMVFTHSTLAKTANTAAMVILIVAIVVEVYTLITLNWSEIADLPLKYALPAFALTHLPACMIGITGIFLLLCAHNVEYLARLASRRE